MSPRTLLAAALLLAGAVTAIPAAPPAAGQAVTNGSGWSAVDAGGEHTCGITDDERLYCWGSDDRGQLGNGATAGDQTSPTEVDGGHTDWVGVSTGYDHTCGRRATGRLYCWGSDVDGELGNGATAGDQASPVEVAGGHTDWRAVRAGYSHTCGRRASGRLSCWGSDLHGQLGEGPGTDDQPAPVAVRGGFANWTSFTLGNAHSCGLRTGGRLYCWGRDDRGQLGEGTGGADQQAPVEVTAGSTTWAGLGAGSDHTCARRTNGRMWCWGDNTYAQTGVTPLGPFEFKVSPVAVIGGITNFSGSISGGLGSTCARRATGRLFCWGRGSNGVDSASPDPLAGNHSDWTAYESGHVHACGRRAGNRLFCWGENNDGRLGTGTTDDEFDPVEIVL